jgi:exodeoxyribonuclease VII small subunit
MSDTNIDDMSFEEALSALEAVVRDLEGGQVPLEKSIDLYERGEALRKHCEGRLSAADLRVEKIVAADGSTEVMQTD